MTFAGRTSAFVGVLSFGIVLFFAVMAEASDREKEIQQYQKQIKKLRTNLSSLKKELNNRTTKKPEQKLLGAQKRLREQKKKIQELNEKYHVDNLLSVTRILQDERVLQPLSKTLAAIDWVHMAVAELVAFLLFIILRANRRARVSSTIGQLWVGIWTFLVFVGVAVFVVPYLLIGNVYLSLIRNVLIVGRQVFFS